MRTNHFFSILLCLIIGLSSCKDEIQNELIEQDFTIQSTDHFELISQYDNGWIKEGRYTRSGQVTSEFEYYENGYIKSAKLYKSFPSQHLYMEVSRSENNEPLSSKYYIADGTLWMETTYDRGMPLIKKVYKEDGTTTNDYVSGMLTSSNFILQDESKRIVASFNSGGNTRKVFAYKQAEKVFESTLEYTPQLGDGLLVEHEVQLGNPFGQVESNYNKLFQTFSSSPSWENHVKPLDYMIPYVLSDKYYGSSDEIITDFALSTPLYQSILEQYPFTEEGILMSGAKYVDGYQSISIPFDLRDSLAALYESDSAAYVLKFGQEYIQNIGYGKSSILVGALRNMPTDRNVVAEIKSIAQKKMNALLSADGKGISEEEQAMLDKVWFEVRLFSYLPEHQNGIKITSYADYEQGINAINAAELSIIQLEYKTVEYL